jgi:hypothetical protein
MVLAVAALLLQVFPPPALPAADTSTTVATTSTTSAAPATPAPKVSTGVPNGASKVDTGEEKAQVHLNLESVKLFSANSNESPVPSMGGVSSESVQNSQSLSTIHIPELKPVKPIPIKSAETVPSRRSWLVLTLAQHGAATFDAYSTRQAVGDGAVEHNPLLRPFVHSPAAYGAIQVCPALLDIVARRMQRSDRGFFRRTWWIPQSVSTGIFVFAGAHNLNVVGRQQALNSKP